jgi:pimeloyl-ACP methyl ester carboxylesterase
LKGSKLINAIQSIQCPLTYKLEGSGRAAVFIQGVGLHGDGWLPQTQELSANFQCLTLDNRGIGRSQPAGTEITMEQMTEDTLAIMDAAGITKAHIVGHSLGGAIALQLALTARPRVTSLSLLCSSSRGAHATELTLAMLWLGLRTRLGTRRMRARAFLEIIMPPEYLATQNRDALAERLQPIFGHPLADSPPIVMRQLKALKRFDVTARLPELAGIPTLVLGAAGDRIFPPKYVEQLAAAIPGARYVEVPGAAHGVTIQSAEVVNQELLQHFISVGD